MGMKTSPGNATCSNCVVNQFLAERAVSSLVIGGVENATTAIAIPATTAPGSYYIIAKADWSADVDESKENNNTKSDATKVGPDLLMATLTAPQTATLGEAIAVIDTTKNQGAGTAGASTTSFYLSSNSTLDGGDTPLGSRAVGAINGGASDVATTTLMIPPATAGGTYYVLAQADSAAVVAEYIETNNVRASGAVRIGADLSITVLTVPEDVGAGQTIDVNDVTTNLGTAEAPATTTRFYWSVNAALDASDTPIGARPVGNLDPGAMSGGTSPVTIPVTATTGSYYVIASADDNHELSETIESNNVKKFKVNVGPDLMVADVDSPTAAEPGGMLSVTDSTQNAGGGAAGPTITSFYLSTNTSIDAADIFLGTRAVPPLTAGQVSTATTTLNVPPATPVSRYYVLAKADHGSAVTEVLETNNVKGGPSIRVGPDLVVATLTAPTPVVRGTSFTIGDTTRNDGGAVGVTTTSYYLSVNTTLDASDLFLGSRSVGPLGADASQSGQVTVVIPAGQAAGNYFIIAKADNGNAAVEINESNNTRSKSIKVN